VNHLPYIVASYALFLAIAGGFTAAAWVRLGRARRRLAAIDPRGSR